MKINNKHIINLVLALLLLISTGCKTVNKKNTSTKQKTATQTQIILPLSDQKNEGKWILNEAISDEFESTTIDTTKWFIEGQNGDYYIWKGRAPSQYAPHNVSIENGILKLKTQWEPNYNFAKESYADGKHNDTYGVHKGKPLPVTTAGIVSKKRFLNGYMEIKSKAPKAAMTAAFWAIGYEQELDMYEQLAAPKIKGTIKHNTNRTVVHDWSPPAVRPTKVFGYDDMLPYTTSDDFHVYGVEWGKNYLNVYRNGKFIKSFHQDELGTDWVLNNPMEIWLDSEVFKWLGVPHKEELPATFEIEYMRVWQKKSDNLLEKDRAFYSFEGPILFEENPRPLNIVPEDSTPNEYQKFWIIDKDSEKYLSIHEGHYNTGVESLKFSGYGKNDSLHIDKVIIKTPKGALNLQIGNYTLAMKIWLDQGKITDTIYISLMNPKLELQFSNLKELPRRKWVSIETTFLKTKASSKNDGLIIEIRKENLPKTKAAKFFIDDITITKTN